MSLVIIPTLDAASAQPYQQIMTEAGAGVQLVTPKALLMVNELLATAGGLLLPDGPPVNPALYGATALAEGEAEPQPLLDQLELRLIRRALELDMPVLALGRGMHLLNVACGGRLLPQVKGHEPGRVDDRGRPQRRVIFVSPGSKTAPIIGAAGFYRVSCQHRQGLREGRRASILMASAYDTEDLIIEGLESTRHRWVIALQAPAHQPDAVPRNFHNLFLGLAERAQQYAQEH